MQRIEKPSCKFDLRHEYKDAIVAAHGVRTQDQGTGPRHTVHELQIAEGLDSAQGCRGDGLVIAIAEPERISVKMREKQVRVVRRQAGRQKENTE